MTDTAAHFRRPSLSRLELSTFRSYPSVQAAFDARPVVLFGPNGAGKTNILEAVSLLSPGRGLRRAPLADITARDAKSGAQWVIRAGLNPDRDTDPHVIATGADPNGPSRRILKIDGEDTPQSQLSRLNRQTWLTPAQDRVFVGPRGERLKFFDRLVLALAPEHGSHANAYDKAMAQRRKILEDQPDPRWLDALEIQLAERGSALAIARADLMHALQSAIDARPDGAFPKADLGLDGPCEARAMDGESRDALTDWMREQFARSRRRDTEARRALFGPHRTDLTARHRPKDMPASECSTGEQKALLVGLALAHARALANTVGIMPLLLLDEVAAHLDVHRRSALYEEILALGTQAWMTGTDAHLFEALGDKAQHFEVRDGQLWPAP